MGILEESLKATKETVKEIANALQASPERKMKRAIRAAQKDLRRERRKAVKGGFYETMEDHFEKTEDIIEEMQEKYFAMFDTNEEE